MRASVYHGTLALMKDDQSFATSPFHFGCSTAQNASDGVSSNGFHNIIPCSRTSEIAF